MPIADPGTYRAMLTEASAGGYALPSINVTSSSTMHGVLAGLAEAECDGIVGVGIGGARFASGATAPDLATGARALAEFAHAIADSYPVNIALHTDHCPSERLDEFVRPLINTSRDRRRRSQGPLFQSHMFDGSHLELHENLTISRALLDELRALNIVLEIEIGLVGGEEDEIDNRDADATKLYTSPADMLAVVEALGEGGTGDYMVAASFGNVHGIHPPGEVSLDPTVLGAGQSKIEAHFGHDARLLLVFHGGSGSSLDDVHTSIDHGVVKMNVDTDTQLAYSTAVAHHMVDSFDQIVGTADIVPSKDRFAQANWMGLGEAAMAQRVTQACQDLRATGTSLR